MADKSGLYITLIVGLVALVGLLVILGNKGVDVTGNAIATTESYRFGDRYTGFHQGGYVGPQGIGTDGAWGTEDSEKAQYKKVRSVATISGKHVTTVENVVCVDNDAVEGENAPYVKSYAQKVVSDERYGAEEPISPRYTDKCKDSTTLFEYSCSDNKVAREEVACETGCGNGVCF